MNSEQSLLNISDPVTNKMQSGSGNLGRHGESGKDFSPILKENMNRQDPVKQTAPHQSKADKRNDNDTAGISKDEDETRTEVSSTSEQSTQVGKTEKPSKSLDFKDILDNKSGDETAIEMELDDTIKMLTDGVENLIEADESEQLVSENNDTLVVNENNFVLANIAIDNTPLKTAISKQLRNSAIQSELPLSTNSNHNITSSSAISIAAQLTGDKANVSSHGLELPVLPYSISSGKSGDNLPQSGNIFHDFTQMAGLSKENGSINLKSAGFENSQLLFSAALASRETSHSNDTLLETERLPDIEINGLSPVNRTLLSGGRNTAIQTGDMMNGFQLNASIGGSGWNKDIGNQIRWMQKMNISSAEIQLHPAELGSMEIKIMTKDDMTTVHFIASNSQAKDLLEQNMPKLRDLLSQNGLELSQSDVSHRNDSSESDSKGDELINSNGTSAIEIETEDNINIANISSTSQTQIDHYV